MGLAARNPSQGERFPGDATGAAYPPVPPAPPPGLAPGVAPGVAPGAGPPGAELPSPSGGAGGGSPGGGSKGPPSAGTGNSSPKRMYPSVRSTWRISLQVGKGRSNFDL